MIFVMVFQEQIDLLNMFFFHDLIVEFALSLKFFFASSNMKFAYSIRWKNTLLGYDLTLASLFKV